jgi:hypothetical protein
MSSPAEPAPAAAIRGEVVYFFAYDLAYDMRRTGLESLLGQRLEPFRVDARKRAPRGQVFFRPLMARLPEVQRRLAGRDAPIRIAVKVLPIGALSVMVRVPLAAASFDELHRWHDPVFDGGGTLEQWVIGTVEKARAELAPHAVRPHAVLPEGESYTVFCLDSASPGIGGAAAQWLETNRAAVAALLTKEPDPSVLSIQEIADSTSRPLSFYRHDLVVSDWDVSLVIDRPSDFDEILYIMELANVQLEELEAYDVFIDEALERAYRDVSGRGIPRRAGTVRELKALRIDLARFSEELSNITKFFGEWYLARVYENTANLFHLGDWHRAIDEKLGTLDSLYEMLKQDQNQRLMVWLEASIVLLFIIDLVAIFIGGAN